MKVFKSVFFVLYAVNPKKSLLNALQQRCGVCWTSEELRCVSCCLDELSRDGFYLLPKRFEAGVVYDFRTRLYGKLNSCKHGTFTLGDYLSRRRVVFDFHVEDVSKGFRCVNIRKRCVLCYYALRVFEFFKF